MIDSSPAVVTNEPVAAITHYHFSIVFTPAPSIMPANGTDDQLIHVSWPNQHMTAGMHRRAAAEGDSAATLSIVVTTEDGGGSRTSGSVAKTGW